MFEFLYRIYELLGNALIIVLLHSTLSKLFEHRRYSNIIFEYGVQIIFFWILYYFPIYALGVDEVPYYYYFTTTMVTSFIWTYLCLCGDAIEKLAYLLYFYSTYKCFKFIFGALYELQFQIDTTLYKALDMLAFIIIFIGMNHLCRLFTKFRLQFLHQLTRSQSIALVFSPLSFFVLLQLADPSVSVPYNVFITIASLLILINLPIMYYLYVTIGAQYESKAQIGKALAETSNQLTRYRYTILIEEQAKKERHELKNNYFYIQALLHEKKYEQLEKYLSDHIGDLEDAPSGIQTNNVLIDHILNTKIEAARKHNIKIYTEVLIPEELAINEQYFCTILLNLLDNAIEASMKEKDPDIQIIINTKNNNLICCVKNRVSTNIFENNPEFKTTKKDKKNHGLGIKIIKNRVKLLNGMYDKTIQDNYFISTVIIPLEK